MTTQAEIQLQIMKGTIYDLSPADQERVRAAEVEIEAILDKYQEAGTIGLTMVALRMQIKDEK